MNKKGNISNIVIFLLIIVGLIFFWNIKDKKIVLYNSKLASVKSIKSNEISPDVLNLQNAFIKVAETLKPAVVNISSIQTIEAPAQEFYFGDPFDFFKDFEEFFGYPYQRKQQPKKRYYKSQGGGSGVIISEDGYILTNEHVIHNANEIKVTVNITGEEKTYSGKVVGKDTRTDLAIVKINAKGLPVAPLGDSDQIHVGEWVIAIGSPFGLEQTVTSGIISAVRQSLVVEGRTYKDFIQTDAAINRGNSGGPLCNIKGEVIGINTAIYAPTGVFSGIGFAIPINRAKEILDDLIHKGKVVRGWLGIEIKSIDDAIKKQFNLPDKEGALINNVLENTPASKYGLKRGDVIREFDNKKIKSPQELQSIVAKTDPKKKVNIKIIRDGKEQVITLVTGEMPTEEEVSKIGKVKEDTEETYSWLDMKVSNLNNDLKTKYQIPSDENGVVIVEIEQDGKAQEIGLLEGDLIKSINRDKTPNISAFKSVTKKVKLADGVVFDIIRQGNPIYISYSSPE